ncbi:MAG: DUF1045 domain-containing protein, partial [Alphaproteobacteria bacterium]|nr:DUF1045 domain-containing protein [Alphaproteobacteria bacterium]
GHFLALIPQQPSLLLNELANSLVRDLDPFRLPASTTELALRRQKGLSPRQDELLQSWGYPYVLDEFRFHLTLTNHLPEQELTIIKQELDRYFDEKPLPDLKISDICLFGDPGDGKEFDLLERFELKRDLSA